MSKKRTEKVAAPTSKDKSKLAQKALGFVPDSRTLGVVIPADGDRAKALASVALDPITKAAATSDALLARFIGTSDLGGTMRALRESVAQVQAGDMRQADAMLVAQATTLDSLFLSLLSRSLDNSKAGYYTAAEGYMRLALKAQSQARTTWESLSKIKNPVGATFIRQANMANGPQQVNNGSIATSTPERAPAYEKLESQPNEILGGAYRGMDSRAEAAAVGGDTQVGTVAEGDRAANGRGKGALKP